MFGGSVINATASRSAVSFTRLCSRSKADPHFTTSSIFFQHPGPIFPISAPNFTKRSAASSYGCGFRPSSKSLPIVFHHSWLGNIYQSWNPDFVEEVIEIHDDDEFKVEMDEEDEEDESISESVIRRATLRPRPSAVKRSSSPILPAMIQDVGPATKKSYLEPGRPIKPSNAETAVTTSKWSKLFIPGTSDIEDDSLDASIRAMSISPRRPGHNNSNRHPSIASVLHVKEEEAPVKLGQYSTHLDAGSRVTTLPAGRPLARPPLLIRPSFEDLRLRNRVDPSDPYEVPFLNPWSKEYFIRFLRADLPEILSVLKVLTARPRAAKGAAWQRPESSSGLRSAVEAKIEDIHSV
ncbi:hypothetical protein BV22DRAFT_1135130 [Leucogyrophana mollusca]|uniref:Uncharacterized protein n=1 Tax=Leucogyrophana mollusca TaxID=85980 RepID=A0ACB8AYV0_9AGAM|nr:hypothetical protein BV22DRAFT_1135130 [Leucogyrophana mollusca]